MGAILLDGVVVEKNAMVAAGSLVRQNTKIPSGEVCLWVYNIQSDYCLIRIRIMYKLC
jgi:carbonic anhydrase/acetyltransferase-like protein (isoleucine patch superfamily)